MNEIQAVGQVAKALIGDAIVQRATKYLTPRLTVKATQQRRLDGRARQQTILVTIGSPNYAEREFIKKCVAVQESFPVRKVQLKFWPKKRRA